MICGPQLCSVFLPRQLALCWWIFEQTCCVLCCLLLLLLSCVTCVTCACCILCLWIFGHANLHNHSSASLLLFCLLNPNNHRATLSALLCLEKLVCSAWKNIATIGNGFRKFGIKDFWSTIRKAHLLVLKGINEWGSVGPALLLSTRVSQASCLLFLLNSLLHSTKQNYSRDHHQHHRVENHFNYRPSASFQVTHFFLSCSKPEDRIMLPLAPGSDIQIHVSWGTRLKTRRQYHASTGRLNIFPCCVARVEQSTIEEIGMDIYLFLICTAAYFCHDV